MSSAPGEGTEPSGLALLDLADPMTEPFKLFEKEPGPDPAAVTSITVRLDLHDPLSLGEPPPLLPRPAPQPSPPVPVAQEVTPLFQQSGANRVSSVETQRLSAAPTALAALQAAKARLAAPDSLRSLYDQTGEEARRAADLLAECRRHLILKNVNEADLGRLIRDGQLVALDLDRDLPLPPAFTYLLQRGLLAIAAPRREGPPRGVLLLAEDALICPAAMLGANRADAAFMVYSHTPARLLRIPDDVYYSLCARSPPLHANFLSSREELHRQLTACGGAGGWLEAARLQHGLTVATLLRTVDLARCLGCGACERACEERFGVARLDLRLAQDQPRHLGMLALADACRTCRDRRCAADCQDEAIIFDERAKEVRILEERCTGCGRCADLCPYDAIKLVSLAAGSDFLQRVDERDRRRQSGGPAHWRTVHERGEGYGRLASKCDHCYEYQEQACISACPTEALFDVRPQVVLPLPGPLALVPAPLEVGHDAVANDGRTPGTERRLLRWLWWLTGAVASAAFVVAVQPGWGGRAGQGIRLVDGCLAVGLYASCLLYSIRGRLAGLLRHDIKVARLLRSKAFWYEYHLCAGTLGTVFALLHSGVMLNSEHAALLAFLCPVVLTGVVAHGLAPWGAAQVALAPLRLADLAQKLTPFQSELGLLSTLTTEEEGRARRWARWGTRGPVEALAGLLGALTLAPLRGAQRRWLLRQRSCGPQVAVLLQEQERWQWRATLLPKLVPVLQGCLKVHRALVLVLLLALLVHMIVAGRQG